MTFVMNRDLADRLELSEMDCLISRLNAIKEIKGNPMGVEIQKFGNATAFSVKNIPGPSFNTIKGLKAGDENHVEKIIEFYKQKDIPVRFDLSPGYVSPDLLTYLNQLGFYQLDFHTTLYKPMKSGLSEEFMDSRISIRPLKEDEFDMFAEIYTKGFQMPAFLKSGVAQNNEILYNNKYWTFYLASMDNEPAGIGVLFIKDGVATLAAAATVPSLRNKGIQSSLIKKRLNQATLEQCDLAVGQAKFGSVSQNNMERAGMRIAYTKAVWVKN
ncbi:GNAT family N-acetyltransferase [Radiobacillus kanasensis]|uniref:GNAT family N-acetyltransferase n=1 Tax=Radiobacillus kanasensis TaxID=2844358 RepID=UPI001E5B5893|nr:GNAT family N-acetyltransferase [Radiobacillus kanasensis]UFT99272.1 GNAT family N-acetyltransferase [Radiobacillus kanasensis]